MKTSFLCYSCFSNCQPNAIISQRIGLEAYCVGPDCSRTLYFKWFMYESDKTFPGREGMIEYHKREEKCDVTLPW